MSDTIVEKSEHRRLAEASGIVFPILHQLIEALREKGFHLQATISTDVKVETPSGENYSISSDAFPYKLSIEINEAT